MDENQERQCDELSTLESICGENEFSYSIPDKIPVGYADICVDSSPIEVFFVDPKSHKTSSITVSYLPPIRLNFQLPKDYPKSVSPKFVISCNWLTHEQLIKLCDYLDEIWNTDPGEEVLYKWMQFLKHETMTFLQIKEINITQRKKTNSEKSPITTNDSDVDNEKENK
ncbi:E3 ubiquitin-protein ligase RNF14-like [Ctenocephalides felis]|nr:E3 ubiquitin-protein ligase RNF14-like [Ctenocephalides felis]